MKLSIAKKIIIILIFAIILEFLIYLKSYFSNKESTMYSNAKSIAKLPRNTRIIYTYKGEWSESEGIIEFMLPDIKNRKDFMVQVLKMNGAKSRFNFGDEWVSAKLSDSEELMISYDKDAKSFTYSNSFDK